MRRSVVVDLDGTLTVDRSGVAYPDKPLNPEVARAAAAARARGFAVQVLTARGMRTWNNDRALVEEHVRPGVEAWLARHDVATDAVHVAKPWCGPRGFYVDDRNLHVEEFVFRFAGPFAEQVFAGFVEGEAPDPRAAHERLVRVERWLEVCAWRYAAAPADVDDAWLRADPSPATWALVVRLGPGRVDPAGFFAAAHDELEARPVVVRTGAQGFALVPRALVDAVGTDLDALAAAVGP